MTRPVTFSETHQCRDAADIWCTHAACRPDITKELERMNPQLTSGASTSEGKYQVDLTFRQTGEGYREIGALTASGTAHFVQRLAETAAGVFSEDTKR